MKTTLMISLLCFGLQAAAGEIHTACRNGDLEAVKRIVKSNPQAVNERGSAGMTPLMYAVKTNKAIVEFLIANKADLNLTNVLHSTALHRAAMDGKAEIVEVLLKGGADVNARDEQGNNAGHWAVSKTAVPPKPVLEVLVAHKIDLNAKGFDGLTVLGTAKRRGGEDVVAFLKSHGAR